MNNFLKSIILIFLLCLSADAQNSYSNQNINFSTESVFIHFNSNLLIPGETLYYKFYCINNEFGELSNISKIGYVQLIGENNTVVFRHKIRLDKGQGHGDFLIPSDVLTGNYKIIGYTNWMNNNELNKFFQGNISIINPYKNQKLNIVRDTLVDRKLDEITSSTDNIKLELNDEVYGQRQKVTLKLNAIDELQGDVSISINKKNEIYVPSQISALGFSENKIVRKSIPPDGIVFYPEARGERIRGKLDGEAMELQNKNVAFSIPNSGIVRVVSTDQNGEFLLNINESYRGRSAYVKVLDDDENKYKIELEQHENSFLNNLNFDSLTLTESDISKILQRSIYNQIENAYLSNKNDSIVSSQSNLPFEKDYDLVYNLDDYKRFSSLREVFVEIINQAYIYKVSKDNYHFVILNRRSYDRSVDPLLILDGVIIDDANALLRYNAKNIKSIKIVRDKYYLGSTIYNGVIVFESVDDRFSKDILSSVTKELNLFKPEENNLYEHKSYIDYESLLENSRIPDYRRQLYWNPNVSLSVVNHEVVFYTSDNVGDYEIKIEGFSNTGKPISLVSTFRVE